MQTRSDCKLSQLPVETQIKLAELAEECRLDDVVKILREDYGLDTSRSALGRFLKKWKEERLKAESAEMSETMDALVAGRDRKKFRKGTLAMLQQRMYDEAIATGDFERVKACYTELAKEEDRAESLELERRRVELAAVNAEIGRRRVELMAAKAPKRVAIECDVTTPEAQVGNGGVTEGKYLTGGNRENGENSRERTQRSQREEALAALARVEEVLNRGGDAAEKILEARRVLGERSRIVKRDLTTEGTENTGAEGI